MKELFCWRCQCVVPMLDEDEYRRILDLALACQNDPELSSLEDPFTQVREAYAEMTGVAGMHHNAILHHRIALYGEPCDACGKPLRSPKATFCAACGQTVKGNRPVTDS